MRTKLFITCMIVTLLSMITLASCSSEFGEMEMPKEANVTFDDELFNLDCDTTQFNQLNPLIISYKLTPTVISDSCEFYSIRNDTKTLARGKDKDEDEDEVKDKYRVPLKYTLNNGVYHVNFKVKNITVKYESKYHDVFPSEENSITLEIEVNKDATNTIKILSTKILSTNLSGTAPFKAIKIMVKIDSDEGGTNHTYMIGFIATLESNYAVIEDFSYAI